MKHDSPLGKLPSFIVQDSSIGTSTRLQCVLERLGVDSRRHCASLIAGGAVSVDGKIVREPGFRVENPESVILVNGKRVGRPSQEKRLCTIVLNKPRGLLCTAARDEGPTVFSCLSGLKERVVTAGRLDKDSDGLLILSNDGALVDRLTHPRYGHTKVYRVQVSGLFDQETLDTLQSSMQIDGVQLRPVRVQYEERLRDGSAGPRHRLIFTLREGRNRQIRRMCEEVGLRVEVLTRIAINRFYLPTDIRCGQWRELTAKEMEMLETIDKRPLRPWHPEQ